ncbi:MAG: NonF [Paenibacillus sp.]|jgi:putative intracellular protease/amidase|nr:NonF [Paenibacillus sp.]
MSKKVLIVVTNHSTIHEGRTTGIWLSEFAEAYSGFTKHGYEVAVASPLGGEGPLDPRSVNATPVDWLDAMPHLDNTLKLEEVEISRFDAIFLPGGHGTMYDLPNDARLQDMIRQFYESNKVVAAVCHGPAGLVDVTLTGGKPLVAGKRVTAFTDQEEAETALAPHMPFLLESKLRELGAEFVAAESWSEHMEEDGNLITGQNPQSTLAVTRAVINKLG